MRTDLGPKPYLYPMPVLVIGTYNDDGTPNAMTAAWGMICDYDKVMLCLAQDHKTVANILSRKAFTVSMANEKNLVQADYVGMVSGNKEPDKIAKTGWTAEKSSFVDAPLFAQLPLTLECTFESLDDESECLVGNILNVSADAAILTDGKIDVTKLCPISYDPMNNEYFVLGKKVGKAFGDGLKLK